MTIISPDTRISALIKANPDVIEVIAGINQHFRKLRNPVLRKVLASRITIREAAKIGKVSVDYFFDRLLPLGFVCDDSRDNAPESGLAAERPLTYSMYLDVRADILSGADPFQRITSEVSRLPVSETLLLVNSFEPVPLIRILREKDFNIFVLDIGVDEVHTYITRQKETSGVVDSSPTGEFEKAKARFDEKMVQMDVRALPMPQPMHAILSALHSLEVGRALFVRHKKVPVFLLSELRDRQYSYVYRFVAEGVHLIIYKDENGQDA